MLLDLNIICFCVRESPFSNMLDLYDGPLPVQQESNILIDNSSQSSWKLGHMIGIHPD